MDDDAGESVGRSGRPEGVGTDYLTDNQLYERVGQAGAVYIGNGREKERNRSSGSPWVNPDEGLENVLRRITYRMEEGLSRAAR